MKYTLLSTLALGVLAGCGEHKSLPTEGRANVTKNANAGSSRIPAGYVATPAGWWAPRSCVHVLEEGARVGRDHVVTRRDGTRYRIPKCEHPSIRAQALRQDGGVELPTNNGWIEDEYVANSPPGTWYGKLTTNWTVPPDPTGAYSGNQVYYTFPAFQNRSQTYIIQPVLQWGSNGIFGGQHWTLASWYVHLDANADTNDYIVSPNRTVTAGSALSGSITSVALTSDSSTWTMTAKVIATGESVTLDIPDSNRYAWAGEVVEVYGLTNCNQYPTNGVFYSAVTLYDNNFAEVWPSRYSAIQSNPSPSCGFGVSAPTFDIANLFHNPAPAPSISSISTNPSPAKQYQPFTFTITGLGFDVTDVQLVYTENCDPPGPNCESEIYGTGGYPFSEKTPTELMGTMTFGTAGTVYIRAQNGLGGRLSNLGTITIQPLY